MKKPLLLILFLAFILSANAQTDSLYYHDMDMESQWGSSTVNDEFGCFVRFTPPVYPATLTGVRGYFRNASTSSEIRFKVYTDPGGNAAGGVNQVYISSNAVINPAAGGIPDQDYTQYENLVANNIVVYAGDVYVGAVQTVDFFGIGIDNLPNSMVAVDRQWQWMTVFGNNYWNTLASQASSGQFGITAFFEPFFTGISQQDENFGSFFMDHQADILTIRIPGTPEKIQLRLFDVSGKLLLTQQLHDSDNAIDMENFTNGIYIGVLNSDSGTQQFKFIK